MSAALTPLRTTASLERAIRDGEMIGARLVAGAAFGSKAEREIVGTLLWQLADVAKRAQAAGKTDRTDHGGLR